MQFAYLLSPQSNGTLNSAHVTLKPEYGMSIYFYKSWLKDAMCEPEIRKWVTKAKCAIISEKTCISKQFSQRLNGNIKIQPYWLENLFGVVPTRTGSEPISGSVEVYISFKREIIEIKIDLSEKDARNLKLKLWNHPSFSEDPEKETTIKHLPDFLFSYFVL
jgi:hypothetical protein